MTTTYLAPLTRPELDTLTREAEHAVDKAHVALRCAPLVEARLVEACGIAQDAHCLLMDCYDESMTRLALEFDRIFDLGLLRDDNG